MNRTMSILVSAMVLVIAGLIVLSMTNTELGAYGDKANESATRIGCERQHTLAVTGEADTESLVSRCDVRQEKIERKQRLAAALSGN